ncbi:MAG: hypothetical protein ACR2K5_04435 [Pseudolabrys sp.]
MRKLLFILLLMAASFAIANPSQARIGCVQKCAAATAVCDQPSAASQKACRAACSTGGFKCKHQCAVAYRAAIKPCLAESRACVTACARH